jgi:cytochrome d ubiquinol oxidase subunit I
MRTREAVTPFPHLAAPFWVFTAVYVFLAIVVVYLLVRQLRSAPLGVTGVASGPAGGEAGAVGGAADGR